MRVAGCWLYTHTCSLSRSSPLASFPLAPEIVHHPPFAGLANTPSAKRESKKLSIRYDTLSRAPVACGWVEAGG